MVISLVSGSGAKIAMSVISFVGPLVLRPSFSRVLPPSPWPSEVMKSSFGANARLLCAMMMKISPQEVAISGAPPPPGRRTFGLS